MTHTLTIRLTDELERWLEKVSRETGIPKSEFVRAQLERVRTEKRQARFMRLAGAISGPASLSARKGYSRK
jgi:predicted DNA-binding protein